MKHTDMQNRQGIFVFAAFLLLLAALLLIAAAFSQKTPAVGRCPLDTSPAAASPASLPAGEVERGRKLFMGLTHLQNGGPPCMGCHNIDSEGLLGGGVMGPDLTDVSSRYTDAGLAQILAGNPCPTMKPIFAALPLTPQEQADLRVFLEASAGQPIANREPLLFGLSLAGLAAAAGFFGFIYRRRLRGVRRPLVKAARSDGQGK